MFHFVSDQETYLDVIYSTKVAATDVAGATKPKSSTPSQISNPIKPLSIEAQHSNSSSPSSSIAVGATPDPAIKLDAFIQLVSDTIKDISNAVNDVIQRREQHQDRPVEEPLLSSENLERYSLVFRILRDLLGMTSNLFRRCHLTSAEVLMALVTSEPINAEVLGPQQVAGDNVRRLLSKYLIDETD